MKATARLRELLSRPGCLLAPGVYNGMFAKQVEEAGFDALYVTGYGTAAGLGYPDVGLITQTEMVDNIRYICAATALPAIADADTGYGNPVNVVRTVQEYERAGAAGLHLEDQVFPKKGGFRDRKRVVPIDEHVQKLRAAVDTRSDRDFLIIARTDALTVTGWDDVVARAHAYRDAGADMVFVDAVSAPEDVRTYSERLANQGVPCLFNGPVISLDEAGDLGFKLQILSGLNVATVYRATMEAMQELMATGSTDSFRARFAALGPGEDMNTLLGLPRVYELERTYGVQAPQSSV